MIMSYPSNLLYTREHEWLRQNEDGTATIGITHFAQSELGDIVFVELPSVGSSFQINAVFGTVEAVKTVSELFAPVSCEVIETNSRLEENPEFVNEDPYGSGWMIRVKLADVSELSELLSADAYQAIIAR
jgi:glycine cleavage system H protein